MAAVLGIDAAWTAANASGYALVEKRDGAWRLAASASSLGAFSLRCGGESKGQGMASAIDCSRRLIGYPPDLVAVDMPLSKREITGRRASDIGVSRRFGAAKCATHSPSAERPGRVSDAFRAACERQGYELIVSGDDRPARALAEVYPHPALLRLLKVTERAPYKAGKTRIYWPLASRDERRARVTGSLRAIVFALDRIVVGVSDEVGPLLAKADSFARLKPIEDMVDAIVCAWIGTTILAGRATAIGDESSAIWIPNPLAPAAMAGAA